MIKTSTLPSSLHTTTESETSKEEQKLSVPIAIGIAEPSANCINNILNYSKSLKILKSELVNQIEVVHT